MFGRRVGCERTDVSIMWDRPLFSSDCCIFRQRVYHYSWPTIRTIIWSCDCSSWHLIPSTITTHSAHSSSGYISKLPIPRLAFNILFARFRLTHCKLKIPTAALRESCLVSIMWRTQSNNYKSYLYIKTCGCEVFDVNPCNYLQLF